MSKLSEHFHREEFECRCCCGHNTVDYELVIVLEKIRQHFDKPVAIYSGCRCERQNDACGGSEKSQHLIGRAADIVVQGINPALVMGYLESEYPSSLGIGSYPGFTHIDTRTYKARW